MGAASLEAILMLKLRFLTAITFLLSLATDGRTAEVAVGGSAIAVNAAPITTNGRVVGTVEAGHSVSVLGVQNATRQAVVSYQSANGTKLVGLVALDNLVSVDGTATSGAANPTNAGSAPFVPSATPAPVATKLDLAQSMDAITLAQFFKSDKAAAKAQCDGQRIKFKGVIDKVDLDTGSSGGEMPILSLKTGTGLPRLKVKLSNSLASNDTFFRQYYGMIPDWWWGYGERALDFRLAEMKEIQVRTTYRSSRTTRWSDGTSTVSRSRSSSQWFTIFKIGEPVSLEATCKGLYMDVEFENGMVINNKN